MEEIKGIIRFRVEHAGIQFDMPMKVSGDEAGKLCIVHTLNRLSELAECECCEPHFEDEATGERTYPESR